MTVPGLVPSVGQYGARQFLFAPRVATVTRTDLRILTANQSTYDINVNLGLPLAQRQILIAMFSRTLGDPNGLAGPPPTLDGVDMLTERTNGGSDRRQWVLSVSKSAGEIGAFHVEFMNVQDVIGIVVYNFIFAEHVQHAEFGTGFPPEGNIDVPADGLIFAISQANDTATFNWTGLSEDFEQVASPGILSFSVAFDSFPTDSNIFVDSDPSSSASNVLSMVSWGPR